MIRALRSIDLLSLSLARIGRLLLCFTINDPGVEIGLLFSLSRRLVALVVILDRLGYCRGLVHRSIHFVLD